MCSGRCDGHPQGRVTLPPRGPPVLRQQVWWGDARKGALLPGLFPGHPRAEGPNAEQSVSGGSSGRLGSAVRCGFSPSGSSLLPSPRVTLAELVLFRGSGREGSWGARQPSSPAPISPAPTSVLMLCSTWSLPPCETPFRRRGDEGRVGRPEPEARLAPSPHCCLHAPYRCQRHSAPQKALGPVEHLGRRASLAFYVFLDFDQRCHVDILMPSAC